MSEHVHLFDRMEHVVDVGHASLTDRVSKLLSSDPELMQDAHTILNELRERAPVLRHGAYVLVSRYDDVCRVLGDPAAFSNRSMEEGTARVRDARATLTAEQCPKYEDFLQMERNMTFMADGVEHAQRRKTTAHLFSPGRTRKMEVLTQQYTDELLSTLSDQEVVDIAPLTGMLPGWIIANLLGLDRDDSSLLVKWGDAINLNIHRSTHIDIAYDALQGVYGYVDDMIAGSAGDSGTRTELFEAIISSSDKKRLGATFVEMQVGGYETTRGLLGGGVLLLMENPDQWEKLVADPSLASNAVEELLRMVSPALWTARVCSVHTTIGDTEVHPGDTLLLMLGGANRDPDIFTDPDRLDITRSNAKMQRAFGIGPHYCIGQSLARLEGAVFFRALATRFPDMKLAGDRPRLIGNANNPQLEHLRIRPGNARQDLQTL